MSEYYTKTGNPQANSSGSSSLIRAEFTAIETGLAKLPVMAGNNSKLVAVNSAGTALETTSMSQAQIVTLNDVQTLTNKTLTNAAGTLTSCTNLPISTGVSGLGTGVATFLATPTSANLAAAVTGETGSGALMFGTNPTITNYVETCYVPSAAASFTVDLSNGTLQKLTTSANCSITLPTPVAGKSYTIQVAYGGTHTLTWAGGGSIRWASGGTAPAATSVSGKVDTFTFYCVDGTYTFGVSGGQNA